MQLRFFSGARTLAWVLAIYFVLLALGVTVEPTNRDLVIGLPSAEKAIADLSAILGSDKIARDTVETARNAYRYFIYDSLGRPRKTTPRAFRALFEANIGECDTAARLFARMRRDDGDDRFRQFDLILAGDPIATDMTRPRRRLEGHSIAAMDNEHGSIGVDPTYGLLIVSREPKFSMQMLRRGAFTLYRLYDEPPANPWDGLWPGIGISIVRAAINPDSDASFAGGDLNASSVMISFGPLGTIIGRLDDSSSDIATEYGSWLDHIGYYYTPGSHIWNFAAEADGTYTLTFRFAPGFRPNSDRADLAPVLRIVAEGSAELLTPQPDAPVALSGDRLIVRVRARSGKFRLVLSAEQPGARKLDAIVVARSN